uniref:HEAT repeat-containing protein n=1 Tax=Physcomitrium patens TaxID=3218 RepID=A0A7I4AXA5_PHYPA
MKMCFLVHYRIFNVLFRSSIAVAAFIPQCNVWHWNVGTIRRVCCRELLQGERLRVELDSLHGQAAMLAALLAVCPRLPLGVPFRLPSAILEVAKKMVSQQSAKSLSAPAEKEAGWMLIGALVSSMPKQELEEQEWELIALWATEFGGNHRDQLNQAERNLPAHLRSWSAAAEALTAFVKSYVVPSSAVNDKEFLLQPIIAYLSSALKYLAFPALQQAPLTLKSAIDLFTIRILRAYQALPDPLVYRDDHVELLGICSLPFREPEKYGASSCLRQLLDTGDASLGPWVPGRDFFEDELRAFEGAADGFSPCVWDIEVPAFAQPLPLATLLVNDMLLCFGNVFAAQGVEFLSQPVKNKLQLLDLMGNRTAGKKQGWKASFTTNVCVALLGGLKASLGVRGQGVDAEALRQVQEILLGILADDSISSAERRAASESLGVLARLGSDSYAARLARLLLTNAISAQTATQKGSLALALGCIHRSVGGMALSALVPSTVQVLCALAKDPTDALHIWSLHGLWLTAEAAGLSYVPHVQATLSVVMELLLSDEHASPELGQSVGRLINAIVAVLGPELSPISSFFMRCKSVVAEINTGEMPAALLECVRFTQQLALFAPQAVSVSSHVQTLRPTLSSRQPTLRQAAVATLRHLVERDSVSLVEEHIEEDLFAMLDSETDERIIRSVRQTLQRLLEAACPSFPSRWLHLCRNVVLATAATKHAASGFLEYEASTSGRLDITPLDDMPMGEDDEGMIVNNAAGKETKKSESKGVEANLPRYKTRLFAAECLSRLPIAVGGNPAHFDLVIAKEQTGGHWLVLHLGELVALAYQVATGSLESVRPMGVELLDTILDKFGKTADPEFEGHLLLEQYQAQLVSAVRTALEPSAGPLLMSVGSRLAARIITSGVAGGDRGVLQRVVALISRPLAKWADLRIPSYAEWVGCKLQVSILGAHAAVKTYAFACSKEGPPKAPDSFVLLPLLAPHTQLLGRCWIGLLRDYISIRTQWATKMQPRYEPFLDGVQLAAVAEVVLPHLAECWPVVLEAVTIDVAPVSQGDEKAPPVTGIEINGDEFKQVWALAILIISADERQGPNLGRSITSFPSFNRRILSSSPTSNHQLVALSALGALCAKGFYRPGMLSVELCQELLQLLLAPRLNNYPWVPGAIVYIVEQIINSSPDVYMEEKSLVLKVAELCLGYMHQLQESNSNQMWNSSETDALVCFALRAASSLTCRLSEECQQLLLPQFLSAGIKVLSEASGNSASASVTFITTVTNATSKFSEGSSGGFGKEERASVLASSVESLARVFETNVTIASKIDDQVLSKRVLLVLGVMVAMAKSVPDVAEFKQGSQARCLSCLQSSLSITHPTIQLAGLQTLRTVAQAGSAEHPRGEKFAWALLLLHKLSSDVIAVIYKESKDTMTSAAAGLVGEALKLLVLLHSLVDGEEAQLEVLHVLLPAIIAAASVDGKENQAALALINAAVKLVTHLASVPSTATQFRKVLLDMPAESRQQLQSIIRASMAQHDSANPSFPTALPPASIPKPVLPPPSSGFLPPPPASAQFIVRTSSTALTSQASLDFDDDDEVDDDWDDFQAHEGNEESPADSSMQPVEDQTEREASEPQASSPHPSTSTSTDLVDEDVKEAMPAQKTGDDTADSLVDSANRTVEKEKLEEDSSVSSLSNSVASPSTSRVPETFPSEFEDEDDMWDSFESAPVIQSGAEETSAVSLHKHDDDDIWDSSLPGEAEKSQRDVEPLVHLHGSNSLEGHGLDVEGDNVEGSANLKEGLASLAADESEGRPLEHNYSENGHVVKVAINVTAVQKDELVDGDELERVENLQSSEAATT